MAKRAKNGIFKELNDFILAEAEFAFFLSDVDLEETGDDSLDFFGLLVYLDQ